MTARSPAPDALVLASSAGWLALQVVCVRRFGNVFGNTVGFTMVLTAGLLGALGAGSYLAGRWADRDRAPSTLLAAYGWSEALAGALGVALAWLLPGLGSIAAALSSYTRGAQGWYQPALGGEIARLALAALLLAPMPLLMGARLALLIRGRVGGDSGQAGARIGALVGLATAGAALGCALADLALVPAIGLHRTQLAAASVHLAAGAIALELSRRAHRAPPKPAPAAEESATHAGPRAFALTALALALTGFAGMGMEMVWLRFLGCSMGQYRAVFCLLIAVILASMGAGALLGGRLGRRFRGSATLPVIVQVLFVLATVIFLAAFDRTAIDRDLAGAFRALDAPASGLPRTAQAWATLRAEALVVGPPSLLLGAAYPLANHHVQRVEAQIGQRAGALFLAMSAGAALGTLLCAFVLLPALGAQGCVLVLAAMAGAAIIPLHFSAREKLREAAYASRADYVFAAGLLAMTVALSCFGMLLPGDHLQRVVPAGVHEERLLAVSEGPGETLAVTVGPTGSRRLWVNSLSTAGTGAEAQRSTHALVHLPLLMMDQPRSVLLVGFGVGDTVHAASLHPGITRLDLAEPSRGVILQHDLFDVAGGGVLGDPRVSVFIDDPRRMLRAMPPGTYDLIALDPPPVSQAGVSAMYSEELYQLAGSRLTDGGMLAQWLPAEELHGPYTLALVRAFADAFPHVVLLSGERHDLVLLGGARPIALAARAVARRLAERPLVAADLERVDLGRLSEIAGTFAAGTEALRRATASARPVTDDVPGAEYAVMSKLVSHRVPSELFDPRGLAAFCQDCDAVEDLRPHLEILGRLYAAGAFLHYRSFAPVPVELEVSAALAGDEDGARARAVFHSGYLQRAVGIDPHGLPMPLKPAALASLEAFTAGHEDDAVAALRLGLAYLAAWHTPNAEVTLRRAVEHAPGSAAARFAHALALKRQQRFHGAVDELRKGLEVAPGDVAGHESLLEALVFDDRREEVPAAVARLLAVDPENGAAHRLVCIAAIGRGELEKARDHCQRALLSGAHVEGGVLARVFGP